MSGENANISASQSGQVDPLKTGILSIPYVSQVGNWYFNDCGAACCAMLLKAYLPGFTKDVDSLFEEIYADRNKNKTTSLTRQELVTILKNHSLEAKKENNLTLARIGELLRNGRPIIALINYNVLSNSIEKMIQFPHKSMEKGKECPHFVLVLGMDSQFFYVNDPDFAQGSLAKYPQPRSYPHQAFFEAWQRANEQFNNGSLSGVTPLKGLAIPVMPPAVNLTASQPDVQNPDSPAVSQPVPTSGTHFVPFQVRVTHPKGINIRSGPAKTFDDVGDLKTNDVRTILAESDDHYYGLIQVSPAQWITLSAPNVERV